MPKLKCTTKIEVFSPTGDYQVTIATPLAARVAISAIEEDHEATARYKIGNRTETWRWSKTDNRAEVSVEFDKPDRKSLTEIKIKIESPHATTRNLVATAFAEAGFSHVVCDGLQVIAPGRGVISPDLLGVRETPVIIDSNMDY